MRLIYRICLAVIVGVCAFLVSTSLVWACFPGSEQCCNSGKGSQECGDDSKWGPCSLCSTGKSCNGNTGGACATGGCAARLNSDRSRRNANPPLYEKKSLVDIVFLF